MPVRLRSDLPVKKVRNQIQYFRASVFEPIRRMLEGFDPIDARATLAGLTDEVLLFAVSAKVCACEFEAALACPLIDNFVIDKGAFAGWAPSEPHGLEVEVKKVA
jgi:hypothetical protein